MAGQHWLDGRHVSCMGFDNQGGLLTAKDIKGKGGGVNFRG